MSSVDRIQLRRNAEAATPGPWYYDGRDIFTTKTGDGGHRLILPLPETWHESQQVNKADALYIAAVSPDVVLALLDALESSETSLRISFEENLRWVQKLERAETLLAALTDALNYIADPRNHHHKPDYREPAGVAREALAALKEEE